MLQLLGVDQPIDYTTTKFEETAPNVDVVLDPVGRDTLARSYGMVKKGGIIMSLVSSLDKAELEKRGIRGAGIAVHADATDLADIAQLIDAGKMKPIVMKVLPFSEAIAAGGRFTNLSLRRISSTG